MTWLVLLPLVLLTLFAAVATRLVHRVDAAAVAVQDALAVLPTLEDHSRRLRKETELTRRALDRRPNP